MRHPTIVVIAPILVAATFGIKAQTYPVTQGKTYKFEKVADGVYYASGGFGSNNVVIVNDQDVLLVDDGTTPAAARAFLADIKTITNKPVRTVVNTHFSLRPYGREFGVRAGGADHRPRVRPDGYRDVRCPQSRTVHHVAEDRSSSSH
jgi:hypothetical protein